MLMTTAVLADEHNDEMSSIETDYFARDTYRIEAFVCPFKSRIDYEPGEIECGLLQVPENREKPDSRFIDLHFVKLNSTWDDEKAAEEDEEDDAGLAPGKRDDPVIYLTGGPGAAAETYVGRFKDHRLRKHRDLYILEQRGIVNSGDFCPKYYSRNPEIQNVGTLKESAEAGRIVAENCMRNAISAGVDISGYNTIENARDVKALRTALGFENWNVWGISYGSVLGQAYLKEDPDGIRAIVIDAIVPLDTRGDPNSWRVVNWYDRVLEKLDELCQADDDCGDAYPDLGERVRDAARAAMENPISVDVKDTELYPSGKAHFLSDVAAFLPFIMFYEQENYPVLPAVIHAWADAVERRDETLFKALASGTGGDFFGGSQGMYDAIMCNDGMREAGIVSTELDREEFPLLTDSILVEGASEALAQSCVDVGVLSRPRSDYIPVQTDIPTLLVEGDWDPITPPPLAHAIAPGFSNMTYVEFPYAGHGPTRSVECAGDMLNLFYDDPTAEPDLSCVDEMDVPDLYGSFYVSSVVPRIAVLATQDKEKMPGVAIWAGLSVLPVVVGFFVLTFAPLVRRFEKRNAVPANGARLAAWSATLFGVLALCILGAAGAATAEIWELILVFGFVPWAVYGAWSGVFAGLLGLVAIVLAIRARLQVGLSGGKLTGFVVTGAAAVSLSIFLMVWGLGP